jgi:hypothetical protein
MDARRFEATVERHGSGTVIVVPFDLEEAFGSGRPPVKATVNGYTFRTTLFKMGGRVLLGLSTEVQQGAEVEAAQSVPVELARDDEPRTVEVPEDMAAALARDPRIRETFDGLSYTRRKEYVRWIEDAKREATRLRRVEKSVEMLREGVETPG